MGSSSSKEIPWAYGNMLLQLPKIDYLPGEAIRGMVHLDLKQPFPGNCLMIKFKGREFTHWIIRRHTGGKHGHTVTDHYRHKVKTHNTEGFIYTWPSISIPAGQYTFPFEMLLPPNLAASFFFKGFECMGMIWYKLKTCLKSNMGQKVPLVESKQMISIIQPMAILNQEPFYNGTVKINRCCCCCDAGNLSITASIEKATFVANEIVNLHVNIDASQCRIKCKHLQLGLKQVLNLTGKHTSVCKSYNLVTKMFPGINDGQKKMDQMYSLTLPPPEPYHFKGTKEDAIVNGAPGTINSTTKGEIVDCSFFIDIVPIMANCCACDKHVISIPIIINSSVFPPINPVEAPPEWNPQVMDMYKFSYAPSADQNLNPNMTQFAQGNQEMTMIGLANQNQMGYAPVLNQEPNLNIYNENTFGKPLMNNQ